MSFLIAPKPAKNSFPSYAADNTFAGVLAMSELAPTTGPFRTPNGFPPSAGQFMSGIGALSSHECKCLAEHAKKLRASGKPLSEVRKRVHVARKSLVARKIKAMNAGKRKGLRPGPYLPGSAVAGKGQGSYIAPGQLPQADTTPFTVADEHQNFSLGALEQRDAAQGTWLAPSQLSGVNAMRRRDAGQGSFLSPKQLSGMGAMSPAAAQRIMALRAQASQVARSYAQPSTAKGSAHQGGAKLYVDPQAALQSSYIEGKIQLEPICDENGKCIRYVDPSEVSRMIGQKVDGVSALTQGQMRLPGFYHNPSLGPWGVDPTQAYQYWAAQQAAMQAGAFATPMASAITSVWGSPGMQAAAPQLPSAPGASASFAQVPGQAVERF